MLEFPKVGLGRLPKAVGLQEWGFERLAKTSELRSIPCVPRGDSSNSNLSCLQAGRTEGDSHFSLAFVVQYCATLRKGCPEGANPRLATMLPEGVGCTDTVVRRTLEAAGSAKP